MPVMPMVVILRGRNGFSMPMQEHVVAAGLVAEPQNARLKKTGDSPVAPQRLPGNEALWR